MFGFVKEEDAENAVFLLRMIAHRCLNVQKFILICFVDCQKAFDKVGQENLIKILKKLIVDGKDVRIIRSLYWNQQAAVSVAGDRSDWQDVRRGVGQDYILSSELFNIYSEIVLRGMHGVAGVNVGGKNINNLRYEHDTELITNSRKNCNN